MHSQQGEGALSQNIVKTTSATDHVEDGGLVGRDLVLGVLGLVAGQAGVRRGGGGLGGVQAVRVLQLPLPPRPLHPLPAALPLHVRPAHNHPQLEMSNVANRMNLKE